MKSRILEWILLVIGFVGVGWFAVSYGESYISQSYDSYKLEQAREGQPATILGYLKSLAGLRSDVESPKPVEPEPPARATVATGEVIGRIVIPRVKVSAVVRQGVDDSTLRKAVGHVPHTALPGEPGNVGIAAHRDTFFRNLRDIRSGDVIEMETPEGTYKYSVDELKIVWPHDVDVLDPTPSPALTLVTCYPFNYVGSAPKRFIVRASQIEGPGTVVPAKHQRPDVGRSRRSRS